MTPLPEVEELVEAARSGDAAAWDALVDRYLPLVTAVIGRFRLSPSEREKIDRPNISLRTQSFAVMEMSFGKEA